jgi:hypothetical protein
LKACEIVFFLTQKSSKIISICCLNMIRPVYISPIFINPDIKYLYICLTYVRFILHCDVVRKHCLYTYYHIYFCIEYSTHLLHSHPSHQRLYICLIRDMYIFTCPFLAVHYNYIILSLATSWLELSTAIVPFYHDWSRTSRSRYIIIML